MWDHLKPSRPEKHLFFSKDSLLVTFECNKIIFKSKSEDYFHFFFWVAELLVKKFSHFQHTFTIRVKRLTARAWIIGTPIKQCTRLRALPRDLRWWVMHNRSFQNIQTKKCKCDICSYTETGWLSGNGFQDCYCRSNVLWRDCSLTS